jgi:hypothetical protein
MSKYRQTVQQMLEENKDLFDNFKAVHDAYVINPDINKAKFNALGSEVMDVIRDYERRFLGHMSRGTYGKFAANVSDKFLSEIEKIFPKIMFVGVE